MRLGLHLQMINIIKTQGKIILRWLIQRDVIDIPKSVKNERMKQNIEVFDFAFTDEDILKIAMLDTKRTQFMIRKT
ncbi:hypothetical protein [Campylobacter concisus]|jgi:hypothetical protein bbifN4_03419|uniref:hypothetical protein n=1 Tax=Campylobacter concisus TaxID=199 RepID=UPI00122CD782|nr:hypothetical protein [Campylobacter concisus]